MPPAEGPDRFSKIGKKLVEEHGRTRRCGENGSNQAAVCSVPHCREPNDPNLAGKGCAVEAPRTFLSAHAQLLSIFLELNSDVPAHVAPQPYRAPLIQTSSCMRATYRCPVTLRPHFYSLFFKKRDTTKESPSTSAGLRMPKSLYESFQSRGDALRGRPA